MTLHRAVRSLIATAASTLVLAGCRGHGPSVPSGSAGSRTPSADVEPGAPGAPLTVADLEAYQLGEQRELELMRAALEWLRRADGDSAARRVAVLSTAAAGLEREGALAAGLGPDRYRALVARVDSVLRARGRAAASPGAGAGGSGAGEPGDDGAVTRWRFLDSLRVELAVVRSRFAAAVGEGTGAAR